jgi:hypothetical protein
MPDGLDDATVAFSNEVAPATRPRDQGGKFVATREKPEPMFDVRPIEGDPLTGDVRDGGDNERLRTRERQVQREPDDGEVEDVEREPENVGAVEAAEEPESEEADDGARYEVVVDGRPAQISLQEALNGYVRQDTFHKRMAQVNEAAQQVDANAAQLQQGWAMWHKARQDYEEDLVNLTPREPDWDALFARDPQLAHAQQKIYQQIYAQLTNSRQMRAQREAYDAAETDRRVQKYAVDGFSRFVMDNIRLLPDEPTLKRNIQSMRRTAMNAGFSEYEVATVYDPRMLTILLKASKYDRMTANSPKAVIPDKGKALAPGAATPLGNVRRSGFNDAQRRLAESGRLQDAVEVFRRML